MQLNIKEIADGADMILMFMLLQMIRGEFVKWMELSNTGFYREGSN